VAASGLPVWTPALSRKGRGSSPPVPRHRWIGALRSPSPTQDQDSPSGSRHRHAL